MKQYLWHCSILLVVTALFIVVLTCQPEHPTREELIETNQQLSLENLKLKAQISTYQEECNW